MCTQSSALEELRCAGPPSGGLAKSSESRDAEGGYSLGNDLGSDRHPANDELVEPRTTRLNRGVRAKGTSCERKLSEDSKLQGLHRGVEEWRDERGTKRAIGLRGSSGESRPLTDDELVESRRRVLFGGCKGKATQHVTGRLRESRNAGPPLGSPAMKGDRDRSEAGWAEIRPGSRSHRVDDELVEPRERASIEGCSSRPDRGPRQSRSRRRQGAFGLWSTPGERGSRNERRPRIDRGCDRRRPRLDDGITGVLLSRNTAGGAGSSPAR